MRVECPRCHGLYDSILRECSLCGCINDACTAKKEELKVSIDQSVLIPFRRALAVADFNLDDTVQEALEEWLDRRQKGKR